MAELRADIEQQSQRWRSLVAFYAGEGAALLAQIDTFSAPLLTGMGASFNAAQLGAIEMQRLGVPARAVEATELVFYGDMLLKQGAPLVFISQSGASAEVAPLVERTTDTLVGVVNTLDSALGRAATVALPILAGAGEAFVATRTYSCSVLATLLLARHWAGAPADAERLIGVADACDALLADASATVTSWLEALGNVGSLIFLGHGPHAVTARQAAMMTCEWAKLPAIGGGAGAFRHGLIEVIEPNTGVVVFAAPGPSYASACALAAELAGYGAQVLIVEHGRTRRVDDPAPQFSAADELLAPLLDIVPAQLFVDALPAHRGTEASFRYISKVVTKL